MTTPDPTHFKGKDAVSHVAEAQAQGIITAAEIHGTELPGHLSAATDAARDTAIFATLLWLGLQPLQPSEGMTTAILAITLLGWLTWKACRSAWLGWSRLERLHRVLNQEKWEIEHHRQQEREELGALYASKGFEGKLLEDVLDVLMADGDRLLRVMVEEELGLSLESHEHPLKQGLGAVVGALIAGVACLLGFWIYPAFGMIISALIVTGAASFLTAYHTQNRQIPAVVWTVGIAILGLGLSYFLIQYFFPKTL